ncbi:hypothetical protein ACIP79_39555 [Streptomyces sp. NPDC088747]|uniref:hypothetical protein n=1 Tax=Streptomyces sp. NPDC088747 TaxID=3365886 RepID=UPI0037FDF23E
MNVSSENFYIVNLPWWMLVVAWLAAVNVALAWEAVKKDRKARARQSRANSGRSAQPTQSWPDLGTALPPSYPNAGQRAETAAASRRPQNESSDWKMWLGVAANVVGIVGGVIAIFAH